MRHIVCPGFEFCCQAPYHAFCNTTPRVEDIFYCSDVHYFLFEDLKSRRRDRESCKDLVARLEANGLGHIPKAERCRELIKKYSIEIPKYEHALRIQRIIRVPDFRPVHDYPKWEWE